MTGHGSATRIPANALVGLKDCQGTHHMTKSPSILRIVSVNVLILIAGLVLIELIFGSWFSNAHALYQFTIAA